MQFVVCKFYLLNNRQYRLFFLQCCLFLCNIICIFHASDAVCNFYLPFRKTRLFIFYAFFVSILCNTCTNSGADFLRLDILHKFIDKRTFFTPFARAVLPYYPFICYLCHFFPFIYSGLKTRTGVQKTLFTLRLPSCIIRNYMIYCKQYTHGGHYAFRIIKNHNHRKG